ISRISRPPVGYQLVGWLIDVNGNELRLPDITGPPPERVELANADVQDAPGITTDNGILDANFRVMQDALGSTWYNTATGQYSGSDLRTFMMVLQPKSAGSGMGPIAVQTGAVPELIILGQEEEE
ncbi:MAG: hypothetical protein JSU87_03555, partial [Gemmatimonadota bacterium]